MANPYKEDKIEKIEKIGLDKTAGLNDELAQSRESSRVKFDDALAKADPSRIQAEIKIEPPAQQQIIAAADLKPSILDFAGRANQTEAAIPPPTQAQVLDRAELTKQRFSEAIDLVKDNVDHPVAAPERASMTASIQHADRYLNQALSHVTGVETKTAIDASSRPPLMRFLSFLTEGEKRLNNFITDIKGFDVTHKRMGPEQLLGVQIRLGFVQTEIEFFTNILSKSLESTKTIMNVQI